MTLKHACAQVPRRAQGLIARGLALYAKRRSLQRLVRRQTRGGELEEPFVASVYKQDPPCTCCRARLQISRLLRQTLRRDHQDAPARAFLPVECACTFRSGALLPNPCCRRSTEAL